MKILRKLILQVSRNNRLYIVPTFDGAKLFFLTLILLFTGLIYANNFILFFNFLLFSLFICSMFYTHFNLTKVTLESAKIESTFAGHWADITFHVVNESSFPRYQIEIHLPEDNSAFKLRPIMITKMEPNSRVEVKGVIECYKRGSFALPRFKVLARFPFNFFRTFTYFKTESSFYIYPEPKVLSYATDYMQSLNHQTEDDHLSLREFKHGDSYRHVHWKKFALDQTMLLKEVEREYGMDIVIEGDELSKIYSLEEQLSILSFMVNDLYRLGRNFGLRYRDYYFSPSGEREQYLSILEKLSVVG